MKYLKKIMMLAMALAIVMTCLVPTALAAETTGSITLSNAAIGKEYNAYKILDATYSGEKIAYTTKTPELFSGEGSPWAVQDTADASGNYNVRLVEGKNMEAVNTWIAANLKSFTAIKPTTGVGSDNVTANKNIVTWNDLDYGYYYITSGLGTVVTVDSVKPDAKVVDKNTTNPGDSEKTSDSATAQIGDAVKFTVTFTATNYITVSEKDGEGVVTATTKQITSYTVQDSANGFDYLIDAEHPVTVKVGGNDAATENLTYVQQTGEAAGTMEFTIDWDNENGEPLYQFSEEVTITYWGVVNEFAVGGDATNEVSISNSTGEDTLAASATTNTYNLTINKTDDKSQPLTGAKFELYRNATNGTALSLVDITTSITAPADKTSYYRVAVTGDTGVTTTIDLQEDTYSSAVIYGLDGADTYYVQEIEAPKGYNKLPGATQYVMNNADGAVKIENEAGVVLPSTGGMGTTLFYILGSVMVVGALVIMVTNKRMGKQ